MPDIAMCLNEECPRKAECYRYMARPSEYRQSYMAFKAEGCEDFVPLRAALQEMKSCP